jgi:arylsulfatase A-like enzyme
MSIMTGVLPEYHGVQQLESKNPAQLSESIPTLASLLRDHGYATYGLTGGGNVHADLGFDHGMDVYEHRDFAFGPKHAVDTIEKLAGDPSKPFFLFLHTYAVHDPYVPPEPYHTRFTDPDYDGRIISSREEMQDLDLKEWSDRARVYWDRVDTESAADVRRLQDLYDGAIVHVDSVLRRLHRAVQRAGALDRTVFILLSDHGEEFGEHGRFKHEQLYEELLHVPLIMVLPSAVAPRMRPGLRIASPVRLMDVSPTVLEIAGVEVPDHFLGVSLLPVLNGGPPPPPEIAASWRDSGQIALRSERFKLMQNVTEPELDQLFDLDADAGERRNLARQRPEVRSRLAERLHQIEVASEEYRRHLQAAESVTPDEETLKQLRALGYIQ